MLVSSERPLFVRRHNHDRIKEVREGNNRRVHVGTPSRNDDENDKKNAPRTSIGGVSSRTFTFLVGVLIVWQGTQLVPANNLNQERKDRMLLGHVDFADGKATKFVPELVTRIRQSNFTDLPIVPVVHWPYVEHGTAKNAEQKHIEVDGIQESPYLRMSMDIYDFDPNVVWIGDTSWIGKEYGWDEWCDKFLKVIHKATKQRMEQKLPTKWPIHIVDFNDHARLQRCPQIEQLMGRDLVHYSKRSMVATRKWKGGKSWVQLGFIKSNDTVNDTALADGTVYQHTPLGVRTDTIESLSTVLNERKLTLASDLERIERPTDVTHLWPRSLRDESAKSVNPSDSKLRYEVSRIMDQMSKDHNLNNFVDIKGKATKSGRQGVMNEYIEALLDTKIMVVTQRDAWEDHYRLMEALISGTCVFSDLMLGVPAGLQNGKSVIFFTSADDLESKILYYLAHDEERMAIGREGRYIAMTRHRSWHRMEEIVFGQVLSTCEAAAAKNDSNTEASCPWIVHGTKEDSTPSTL